MDRDTMVIIAPAFFFFFKGNSNTSPFHPGVEVVWFRECKETEEGRAKCRLHMFSILPCARADFWMRELYNANRCLVHRLCVCRFVAWTTSVPRCIWRRPACRNYKSECVRRWGGARVSGSVLEWMSAGVAWGEYVSGESVWCIFVERTCLVLGMVLSMRKGDVPVL